MRKNPISADFWNQKERVLLVGDAPSDVTAAERSEMMVKTWPLGALLWWGSQGAARLE